MASLEGLAGGGELTGDPRSSSRALTLVLFSSTIPVSLESNCRIAMHTDAGVAGAVSYIHTDAGVAGAESYISIETGDGITVCSEWIAK